MTESPIFNALPGVPTPVAEVRNALDKLWAGDDARGGPAASEYRASQANLILHFGLNATPEAATAQFQAALRFSHRYPCRILVLCPRETGGGGDVLAKIFSECYLGEGGRDMSCMEAIVLTYPLSERAYLQDQASIMFEPDLPIYYWPQYISKASRLGDYKRFLAEVRRVVFDSAIESEEVVAYAWPRPEIVRDLAYARLLPVRQCIGHFVSYIPPERLVEGLISCTVQNRPGLCAEARCILRWMRGALEACARQSDTSVDGVAFEHAPREDVPGSLVVSCGYSNGDALSFTFDFDSGSARLESTLSGERRSLSSVARPLAPENALAEALFFE